MKIIAKTFDELTKEELYEILRCRTEVFVLEQNCTYQDLDGKDVHSIHVFIRGQEGISAYLRVIKPGVKYPSASIGRVLTMKGERRKGLSRMLMEKGIEIAKSMSPDIEIEAQSYLTDFYKSLGFRVCSEEFILEHRPHVSMKMP